jgi:hypothetical protein
MAIRERKENPCFRAHLTQARRHRLLSTTLERLRRGAASGAASSPPHGPGFAEYSCLRSMRPLLGLVGGTKNCPGLAAPEELHRCRVDGCEEHVQALPLGRAQ